MNKETFLQPLREEQMNQLAGQIAAVLGENGICPRNQIRYLLAALGKDIVFGLLRETLAIEQGEGMLTANGERRRSPGGVFFTLARKHEGLQAYRLAHPRPNILQSPDPNSKTQRNKARSAAKPGKPGKIAVKEMTNCRDVATIQPKPGKPGKIAVKVAR